MTAHDVLRQVRAWRDNIAGKAAHMEARGDRYGDHDAWAEAQRLNAYVRDLNKMIDAIVESMTAEQVANDTSRVTMGMRWAHTIISNAIGVETDARRRDGMAHAANLVLNASRVVEQ